MSSLMRPLCSIDSSGCNENPGQPGSGFSFFLFFPPSILLRRTGSISSSSIGLLSLHYKGSQPERDEEREMETIKQCGKVSQILTIVNQLLHPLPAAADAACVVLVAAICSHHKTSQYTHHTMMMAQDGEVEEE